MADTRRLRKGYVTLAMAVPAEIAKSIRVQAVLAEQSIGDYVASLIPQTSGLDVRRVAPRTPRLQLPSPEPSQSLSETRIGHQGTSSGSWTPERLKAALDGLGYGSQSKLAKHLGIASAAIRGWLQGRVPQERWGALEEFFAQAKQPLEDE